MSAIVTSIQQINIEPVKTVNPAANDLPQINEPEDEEKIPEKGKFAELLAGLLRNIDDTKGVQNAHSSSEKSQDETVIGVKPGDDLIPVLKEADPWDQSLLNSIKFDALRQDDEAPDAQALLFEIETALGINEGDHLKDIHNFPQEDTLKEAELEADFFDINLKNNSNNIDALQTSASASKDAEAKKAQLLAAQKNQDNSVNPDNLAINSFGSDNENALARSETQMSVMPDDMQMPDRNKNALETRASRRGKVSVEVTDARTNSLDASGGSFTSIEAGAGRAAAGTDPAARETTLELRLPQSVPEQNNAINQANTSWEAKAGSALENLLARELHQNFNGDIVRHASILLRDADNAIIRLALKPETLGNVKIALELSDNKITGKIFVESEEALNAFRKEVASLEQTFKESGFEAANLDLSLTSDNKNTEGWGETPAGHLIASRYDDTSCGIEKADSINLVNIYFGREKGSINILA